MCAPQMMIEEEEKKDFIFYIYYFIYLLDDWIYKIYKYNIEYIKIGNKLIRQRLHIKKNSK